MTSTPCVVAFCRRRARRGTSKSVSLVDFEDQLRASRVMSPFREALAFQNLVRFPTSCGASWVTSAIVVDGGMTTKERNEWPPSHGSPWTRTQRRTQPGPAVRQKCTKSAEPVGDDHSRCLRMWRPHEVMRAGEFMARPWWPVLPWLRRARSKSRSGSYQWPRESGARSAASSSRGRRATIESCLTRR